MNPYQKLLQRKRAWTPVQVEAGTFKEGAEESMLRALALRSLEIPVGDFIKGALKGDFPEDAREVLESNIKDEEKHDLALDYIAKAHKLTDNPEAALYGIDDTMYGYALTSLIWKLSWLLPSFFSYFRIVTSHT